MKIDFYISSLSGGGAEHVLTNLASDFANKSHDVCIASYEKRPQFYVVNQKVKINKYDNNKKGKIKGLIADFFATRKQLKERKADVAISFLSRCNLMLILAGLFSKTKIIVCDRNNLLRKYPKYVFKASCFLYRFADAVCVQTNEIKAFYPEYLQKKMYVLENPLDFDEMQKQCEGDIIEKENTILSVGRLEKQKDFVTLIKAFSEIAGKYPEWSLKIFGKGNRRDELEGLIKELNLENRAFLCGVTNKPFLEMKKAKVFVLSSFYEGFPNVLCEAMHAGSACVATSCECGPGDLINDGENGYLVEVGNIQSMKEKMEYLINNDETRKLFGENAKKSVERLELSAICEEWMKMIVSTLR